MKYEKYDGNTVLVVELVIIDWNFSVGDSLGNPRIAHSITLNIYRRSTREGKVFTAVCDSVLSVTLLRSSGRDRVSPVQVLSGEVGGRYPNRVTLPPPPTRSGVWLEGGGGTLIK